MTGYQMLWLKEAQQAAKTLKEKLKQIPCPVAPADFIAMSKLHDDVVDGAYFMRDLYERSQAMAKLHFPDLVSDPPPDSTSD